MSRAAPVVVTGLDLVAWPGHGVAATWTALGAHRRAPSPATPAPPHLRYALPAELESQGKFLSLASEWGAHAVAAAIAAARLLDAGLSDERKGLFTAQTDLTVTDFAAYRAAMHEATDGFAHDPDLEALNAASVRRMNPFYLLDTLNNNAFSLVSAWHGLRGANTSTSGWRAAGLAAFDAAARAVARDDAAAAVMMGAGRLAGPVTSVEVARLGVLPPGIPPADAAAALVLEPEPAARARGAAPLARVLGTGLASKGRGSPHDAVRAAAEAACAEGGVALLDVGLVLVDTPEATAAAAAGTRGRAWRAALGEAGPGSDAVDLALAATALHRGVEPDGRPCGTTALVLATGLDGQAAAVLLGRAG